MVPRAGALHCLSRTHALHGLVGMTMHRLDAPLDAAADLGIEAALAQLRNSKDVDSDLVKVLDIAIGITGADMGTVQRFEERDDCLRLVASRGISSQAVDFFAIVRRNTNTTCAAAFTQRMRVFVEDISTSYLFVGTRELDILTAGGIVAAQSTPLITSNGRLRGVITTHFREPQIEAAFDHALLDRLAVLIADILEQQESLVPKPA